MTDEKCSDNTAGAGGFLLRPLDHGVDIIVASAASWLSISGTFSAGIIIDSGKFNWPKSKDRFPQFFEPSPGFHGLKLWDKFKNQTFIVFVRAAVMRDIGSCLNPFEAFQLLAGLETLSVRMERISSNASTLALWLESNERVCEIRYPGLRSFVFSFKSVLTASGLASNLHYVQGHKYLNHNYGGVISFAMNPTTEASVSVFDKFKLVSRSGRLVKFTSRSNSKSDIMKLMPAFTVLEGASKLSALKLWRYVNNLLQRTVVIEGEGSGEGQQARPNYISVGLENIVLASKATKKFYHC